MGRLIVCLIAEIQSLPLQIHKFVNKQAHLQIVRALIVVVVIIINYII